MIPIWRRAGFVTGAIIGVVIGATLEWYFNWGPAATSADRGEAHGYWLMLVGFPFTWIVGPLGTLLPLVVGRLMLILAVGATWATVGTMVDVLVRPRRPV